MTKRSLWYTSLLLRGCSRLASFLVLLLSLPSISSVFILPYLFSSRWLCRSWHLTFSIPSWPSLWDCIFQPRRPLIVMRMPLPMYMFPSISLSVDYHSYHGLETNKKHLDLLVDQLVLHVCWVYCGISDKFVRTHIRCRSHVVWLKVWTLFYSGCVVLCSCPWSPVTCPNGRRIRTTLMAISELKCSLAILMECSWSLLACLWVYLVVVVSTD